MDVEDYKCFCVLQLVVGGWYGLQIASISLTMSLMLCGCMASDVDTAISKCLHSQKTPFNHTALKTWPKRSRPFAGESPLALKALDNYQAV